MAAIRVINEQGQELATIQRPMWRQDEKYNRHCFVHAYGKDREVFPEHPEQILAGYVADTLLDQTGHQQKAEEQGIYVLRIIGSEKDLVNVSSNT